ncbi:MAG: carbohydrate binding family 9 domain-containing protein [Candidatus Eisenbacteria bacterium]|uniref:Carbohydrate binding family 9 domain-containing protein n=1 Tax=Eiseniibacteriota bacterium TaxID=2212470 RepID=A0A956RNP2_UNCEI|nr:carbohydrate binding family 9 domain-containing protein [Candidatus Eisenbacteria bacterium]
MRPTHWQTHWQWMMRPFSHADARSTTPSRTMRMLRNRIGTLLGAGILVMLSGANTARANFAGFDVASLDADVSATPAPPIGSSPEIKACPLPAGSTIHVDGRLDDDAWRGAQPAGGFLQWNPDRGGQASEQTVFKVAYDQHAVYFGIACLDSNPDEMVGNLARRDRDSRSDYVSVYVDPYNDKTTGYLFRVNLLGVQQDSYLYDDGNGSDDDWDAVWSAETYRDSQGWYAEIEVPLSSIRYRQDASTWGLHVRRFMQARGEESAWPVWEREQSGFVSRFGRLEGIENVPAPRQLEIYPYAVARYQDPAATGHEDRDDFENFGADLQYGVTADLTLNATVQPDFGQVEADPAVLNLSPFETQFSEKRPFFIEGSRYFRIQNFNLFYSRRIGTGTATSRIRAAGKLTGKTEQDFTIGALYAVTDETQPGQTHNPFKSGEQVNHYLVGRFGKEFSNGDHSISFMQTATMKTASREEYGDRASREAYTSGLDFHFSFADRGYAIDGSVVGSIVDPEKVASDPGLNASKTYGTGGEIDFAKRSGTIQGGTWGRWEGDRLDINDIGFLGAPDEANTGAWLSYIISPKGEQKLVNRGNLNFNYYKSWLYAARSGDDVHTGETAWSYGRGHRQSGNYNVNTWVQLPSYWELWGGADFYPEGTQRFETRTTYLAEVEENGESRTVRRSIPGGGPLIDEPTTYGGWWGINTDSRKAVSTYLEGSHYWDAAANVSHRLSTGVTWTQSSAVNHQLSASYRYRLDDTQHLENYEATDGGGVGGISYVFGEITQRTVDVTLRTNVLFNRNQSLELYLQPFLSVGDYTRPRRLTRADTYDLEPYTVNGFRAQDFDFRFSSVNLNMVYRWQYRPGSTLYLVWTQARSDYDERRFGNSGTRFDNSLGTDALFGTEPENVFLVKLTYWLPI